MPEILGTSLTVFEEPIHAALEDYSLATMTRTGAAPSITFDLDAAMKLGLTPEKPNSARSTSTVKYLGETAGTLYVIAFAPGDCTGAESADYNLSTVGLGDYPKKPGIMPRSKAAMHTEAHLTIASLLAESPNSDPVMFAGSLDLLGLIGDELTALAQLGWSRRIYERYHMSGEKPAIQHAVATVGYIDEKRSDGLGSSTDLPRFGEPHAVFNATNDIQICAFLGITPEVEASQGIGSLRQLGAHVPHSLFNRQSSAN